MSESHMNDSETTTRIFADPVGYLASFGIDAETETPVDTVMPAAA